MPFRRTSGDMQARRADNFIYQKKSIFYRRVSDVL